MWLSLQGFYVLWVYLDDRRIEIYMYMYVYFLYTYLYISPCHQFGEVEVLLSFWYASFDWVCVLISQWGFRSASARTQCAYLHEHVCMSICIERDCLWSESLANWFSQTVCWVLSDEISRNKHHGLAGNPLK